jgi:hypothetical protein
MTELDFDELDKAVNSLMADVDTSKRNPGLDDPEDNVVSLTIPTTDTTPASVTPAAPTESSTPAVPASQVVVETPTPTPVAATPPLAVKRRGQFMDVMHPSSDMKTTTPPVKRVGVNLQPSAPFAVRRPDDTATPSEDAPVENTEQSAAVIMPTFEQEATIPAASQDTSEPTSEETPQPAQSWPDPIDMAAALEKKDDVTTEATTVTAVTQEETAVEQHHDVPADVVEEVSQAPEEPQTSPFLADAKVEKRPLGGLTPALDDTTPEPATDTVVDTPQVTPEVQLPDELKGDVMSLESTSTKVEAPASSPEISASSTTAAAQPEPAVVTGNGSIPQQYTEQPSSGDNSNTSIYDTSTHHQPLEQATHQASPLKWIILGLILLIVGAIAGAVYFYFTTNR